ncbi:kinetochore-associated Ndc80 complex subunit spc24 [Linnemannia schmuckeri]|uniref:Kinetochore protein Spc24 n=1 Tax=Linnemannia schmuckeri TaxID=64567 RepID=A0A9P5S3B8_9FUNG|nr:kinetochore-associated Ndc80 complex subunit spc24 [Linnemannia schmuckeri]
MAAADDNIVTLIQEVASQFQRSGTDLQNIQKTTHDMREAENNRNEMMHDARTLLQKMSRNLQLSRSKGSRQHVDPDSLRHDDRMMEMDQQKFSIAKAIQDMDQDITSLEAEIHQLRMQSLELDSSYTSASDGGGGASNGSSGTSATAGASKSNGSSGEGDGDAGAQGRQNGDTGTNGATVRGRGGRNGGMDKEEIMLNDEEDILDDTAHAMAVLRLQLYRGLGIEMLENELGLYSKARIRSSSKNEVHLVKFDDQLSPYFQTNLIWEFAS